MLTNYFITGSSIGLCVTFLHFNFLPFFALIQSESMLLDDFETAQLFMNHNR